MKKHLFFTISLLIWSNQYFSQNYNLITDSSTVYWPIPAVTQPGYLGSFTDPVFGSLITRIAGDAGSTVPNVTGETWKDIARHGYSKRVAWNADESLLLLDRNKSYPGGNWGSSLFLDGSTYQVLFKKSAPSGNSSRWHPTLPNIRVIISDTEVKHWDVIANTTTVIMTFSGYTNCYLGPYEGNLSNDGNWAAISATRSSDGKEVAFALDFATQTKYPDIDMSFLNSLDWVSISPLGNYIVVNADIPGYGNDRTMVYDLQGNQVGSTWPSYGRPSHYDLSVDGNGDEVAVGVSKSAPDEGKAIKRRLIDGQVTELTVGGYASHASARCINRPGWAVVSMGYRGVPNWGPYYNELLAVKLDGTRVERLCNIRSIWSNYENEAHPSVSPSGSRVIFASDWEVNSAPVNAYVVDFRSLLIGGNNPPNANAGLDKSVCLGDSVQLTATGGGTYSWNTGAATASIWVSPTATTNYIVTVTNAYGSDIDTVVVSIDSNLCAKTVCFNNYSLTIDGVEESLWSGAYVDTMGKLISGSSSGNIDVSGTFKVMWDNTNLYVIAHITDDIKTNDSPNQWNDDGIELFIDGNNDKNVVFDANDRQYIVRWNDNTVYEHGYNTTTNPTGVSFAQTNTGSGYIIEGAIAWTAIGVTPSNGKDIGFEIQVNDDDDGGTSLEARKSWHALISPSGNASLMGVVELDNTVCNNSTGLKNIAVSSLKIYPNPTKDVFEIRGFNSGNYDLVLLDNTGREILRKTKVNLSPSIDISKLKSGNYILRIINSKSTSIHQIVKQ